MKTSEGPYVIAEIGSNFSNLHQARNSIKIAKECGADCVKFQWYEAKDLFAVSNNTQSLLDKKSVKELSWAAKEAGIDFMCTVFDPAKVSEINKYVWAHKIASSDICYTELLKEIRQTGKPVLISTGGSYVEETKLAFDFLAGFNELCFMYCDPSYPSVNFDLRMIPHMPSEIRGFSDHSIDTFTPWAAYTGFDAHVIEKHFTAYPDLDSPDRPHSLAPDDFKIMTDRLRGISLPFEASELSSDFRLKHKRRFVATRSIGKNEKLCEGFNIGIYRPTKDEDLFDDDIIWPLVNSLAGLTAKKDIETLSTITKDMVVF